MTATERIQLNKDIAALVSEKGDSQKAYTLDEIAFINQYEGYGGLHGRADSAESLFEYYTPFEIIEKMVGLCYQYGYTEGGKVLETSCGTGRFLHYFHPDTPVTAYELSPITAQIARINFPTFNIFNKRFESHFINRNGSLTGFWEGVTNQWKDFDLVIGNPPYGVAQALHSMEKKETKAGYWEDYFIFRGLDCLKTGGLLSMIVPHGYLDRAESVTRNAIEQKSDFLDAYRLPHGVFSATDIGTDIIILRKK